MKKSLINAAIMFGVALLGQAAYADQASSEKGAGRAARKTESKAMKSSQVLRTNEGKVESVDKENKSITLQHGPIKSKTVEMGAMTMPFVVEDAALLSGVEVGDKVKFNVEDVKGMPVLTALKVVKK